jgi:hypothetical protein
MSRRSRHRFAEEKEQKKSSQVVSIEIESDGKSPQKAFHWLKRHLKNLIVFRASLALNEKKNHQKISQKNLKCDHQTLARLSHR